MKAGNNMRISNMTSSNGNKVANQFILYTPTATYFQSYGSVIAKTTFKNGKRVVYLDRSCWDYSVTTGKYRNQFLGEGIADTRKKIKSGEYKLTNLNKK